MPWRNRHSNCNWTLRKKASRSGAIPRFSHGIGEEDPASKKYDRGDPYATVIFFFSRGAEEKGFTPEPLDFY